MAKRKPSGGASQNKRPLVLGTLRERIAEGYYPQGFKLIEQDLAGEFEVSRPALREVLTDLENQGLVERKPNRGAMVRRVDPESLLEIMEIREVLEGLAARLAAQNSTRGDWADLEAVFGEPASKMVEDKEFGEFLDLVATFRERMVKAANNKELSKLIYSLFAKITIVQRRVVILPGRMEQAIDQHREILKAIMDGDGELAEKEKRENLRTAKELLMKYKAWIL